MGENKTYDKFYLALRDHFPFIRWGMADGKRGWVVIEGGVFKFIPYPSDNITAEEFIILLEMDRL